MKNRINWELMRPQDIEIRPASIKDGKANLLLFQNSRNTMDALDRNFGEFGWKISYKDVAGQIYGCLSIKDPDTNEWISKEDTGDESNISEKKGQSSDILKRCAVRFGYGRELYTSPKITVDDDGYKCSGYKVSEIDYDDNRDINHLVIVNRFNKEVYRWDSGHQPTTTTTDSKLDNASVLKSFCSSLKNDTTVNQEQLLKFYRYYEKKLNEGTFKGVFKPDALWNKWITPKAA